LKIQITKPATTDLQEIDNYIRQDNPAAAARTVIRVLDAIEYLSTFPTIGRVGRLPRTRELIVSRTSFIVVYQVRQQTVFVLRILHAARKWP
jgi:addiction module RelE/StbE family toxin